jgi:hypothetical protein
LKTFSSCLTLFLLTVPAAMFSLSTPVAAQQPVLASSSAGVTRLAPAPKSTEVTPFSRLAFGGGISPLGINMQAAINVNRHINVRGVGNVFNYTLNNISTNGLNINGKLNFATAGASVDFYPWANHGFRLSPGAIFYNQNAVSADITVAGGTSFSLNDYTYYASSTNPIRGNAGLGLNTRKQAFSMTTGWGNMIPRRGGHWSFPFEIGAAFIGSPTLNMALTGGQACDAQGMNCVNVATDPDVQANLQAQITKYRNDINPFQYYPIISFGASYNFKVR